MAKHPGAGPENRPDDPIALHYKGERVYGDDMEVSGGVIRGFHHHGSFLDARKQITARSKRQSLLHGEIRAIDRYGGTLPEVISKGIRSKNLLSLLHYEDGNSMAVMVESWVPFLDYRVAEYLVSLPLDLKIRHCVTK